MKSLLETVNQKSFGNQEFANSATTLLDVQDLHIYFKSQTKEIYAVRGVNFSLHKGESIAIVGESGCGKSAMAKGLIRLLPNSSKIKGSVYFKDLDLLSLKEKEMHRIRGKDLAMIFQDPMSCLNPTMKIGQQIIEAFRIHFPLKSKKAAFERAIELLNLVGIPEPHMRMAQYPYELSGGLRQRMMIATALSASPKILIADEPTTALDVSIQAQILELLKNIQKTLGMSIILITHDLSSVVSLCDRVLVMYAGMIVEEATIHQLFSSPAHPYTQKLLKSLPRMDQDTELIPIEGNPPNLSLMNQGCPFFNRCGKALEICHHRLPNLKPIKEDQQVRCFLHD